MFTKQRGLWDRHLLSCPLFAVLTIKPLSASFLSSVRCIRVPVEHVNIDHGLTVPSWAHIFQGRARVRSVTLQNGVKFKVVISSNEVMSINSTISHKLGMVWRGEVLVFRAARYSDLWVNMRTYPSDRALAWEAIRR